MEFHEFASSIEAKFNSLAKSDRLFVVDLSRESIWESYLASFPKGTNEIFREREGHNCSSCKNFILNIGGVVSIKNGKVTSVWDVELPESEYKVVANSLSALIKATKIKEVFYHFQNTAGIRSNLQLIKDSTGKTIETLTWHHLFCQVPSKMVVPMNAKLSADTLNDKFRTNVQVLKRTLEEISYDAIDPVLELIADDNLARGQVVKPKIDEVLELKRKYDSISSELRKDSFLWENVDSPVARFKNEIIGTILAKISEGEDFEACIKLYETAVSGANYQRPKAIVTEKQRKESLKKFESWGIEDSLHRRFAMVKDISPADVLYVDSSQVTHMKNSLANILLKDAPISKKKVDYSKIAEVTIEEFISNIRPKASSIEVFLENRHVPRMVSLTTEKFENSPRIFAHDNPFCISYKGGFADAVLERVKAEGGCVDAPWSFMLGWDYTCDLDFHGVEIGKFTRFKDSKPPFGKLIMVKTSNKSLVGCLEMAGFKVANLVYPLDADANWAYYEEIMFNHKKSQSGGELDVDMNAGNERRTDAVENIFYKNKPKAGRYELQVHNFSKRDSNGVGFTFRLSIDGNAKTYHYKKSLSQKETVTACIIEWDGENEKITIPDYMEENGATKEIWGLHTQKFHKVTAISKSPNHWGDQKVGHMHYLFFLEGCINDEPTRGFYNEFLATKYKEEKRVWELLGSKMLCESSDNQLSGIGFSSTNKDSLIVKVSGSSLNRQLKINF